MMDTPMVSIIIPVYNGSNYLKEAIDSALSQTYTNCEILVINDGSDDYGATENVALSYGNRVRYYKKENGGVASALNYGIQRMQGEYFAWLSHDDFYYPEKIQAEVEAVLDCGDKTRLVQCEYEFYDQHTKVYTQTNFSKDYAAEQITNSIFSVLQFQIHACSALIHRSHFERVGLFDESIRTVQDIEMWFRLFRNQRSVFVPRILYMVREHNEAGNRTIICYYEETCRIYQKLIKQMEDEEIEAVFGSAYRFLVRMNGFIRSYLGNNADIEKRIAACGLNDSDMKNRDKVRELLGVEQGIYIFGAGRFGKRVKYELEMRGFSFAGFLDNNREMAGREVDGIICDHPDILAGEKESRTVVVAVRNYGSIVEQLRRIGNVRIVAKQEIDACLVALD